MKQADIEIKGITVLAGYNGTGKSTICKAMYASCTAFGHLNQRVANARENSIVNCIEAWDDAYHEKEEEDFYWSPFAQEFVDSLERKDIQLEELNKDIVAEIANECGVEADEEAINELYRSLRKVIDRPLEDYARFVIEREFLNCFSDQINSLGEQSMASIELQKGNFTAKTAFATNKLLDSTVVQVRMAKPVYIETNSHLDMIMAQRRRSRGPSKVPTSALLRNREEDLTIEEYEQLEAAREICAQIIQEITHGALVANSKREILYHEDGVAEDIACTNIASGLKNILMIEKFLDNGYLKEDSLLLIDEPEVNLHPEWQVKFAEILVLLCKRLRIKMLLNTHSPYFMRAIETKLAEHELEEQGKYYYMQEDGNNRFVAKDVTGKTEIVYATMYKPLEEL